MSLLARRRAVACVATLLVVLASTGQTVAFTPNVEREWNHFAECLPLMFSNPQAHAELCGPFPPLPLQKSLSEPGPGAPTPSTPPECPMDGPCKPECIPDLPCDPDCPPDLPCPKDDRG